MPKYAVSGWVSMSVWAEVEAEDEEGAKEAFLELQAPGLCWQCSGAGGSDGTFQLNGFDDNLNVVDVYTITTD